MHTLSARMYNIQQARRRVWLYRVAILESFVEAGERLCGPDIGRELLPPLRCQKQRRDTCACTSMTPSVRSISEGGFVWVGFCLCRNPRRVCVSIGLVSPAQQLGCSVCYLSFVSGPPPHIDSSAEINNRILCLSGS